MLSSPLFSCISNKTGQRLYLVLLTQVGFVQPLNLFMSFSMSNPEARTRDLGVRRKLTS